MEYSFNDIDSGATASNEIKNIIETDEDSASFEYEEITVEISYFNCSGGKSKRLHLIENYNGNDCYGLEALLTSNNTTVKDSIYKLRRKYGNILRRNGSDDKHIVDIWLIINDINNYSFYIRSKELSENEAVQFIYDFCCYK